MNHFNSTGATHAPNVPAQSPWLQWALYYVSQGFRVLPLEPEGKRPLTLNGLHDASADPALLTKWIAAHPNANLGIVPPDGVIVVDVDPRNGGTDDGLPETRRQRTGGGGAHALYRVQPGQSWPSKLREGVDLKTSRGYVVAAPSVVRQPDGSLGAYSWIDPAAPIQPAPAIVANLGRSPGAVQPRQALAEHEIAEEAIDRVVVALEPLCTPGQRHEVAKRLGSWLGGRGWSQGAIEEVCERLPFEDPNGRTKAAIDCMALTGGKTWFSEQLGAEAFDALDRALPNPAFAATQADVEDSAAIIDAAMAKAWPEVQAFAAAQGLRANDVHPAASQYKAIRPRIIRGDDPGYAPAVSLVEGFELVPGRATLLSAEPSFGKTPFTLQLCLCIANGKPFLDLPTTPARCAFVAFEKASQSHEKLKSVARAIGVAPGSVDFVDMQGVSLTKPGALDEFAAMIRAEGWRVVVVDHIGTALAGSETHHESAADPLNTLRAMSPDVALLFLRHHSTKKENTGGLGDIMGATAFAGFAEAAVSLLKNSDGSVCVKPARSISGVLPAAFHIRAVGNLQAMCFHRADAVQQSP